MPTHIAHTATMKKNLCGCTTCSISIYRSQLVEATGLSVSVSYIFKSQNYVFFSICCVIVKTKGDPLLSSVILAYHASFRYCSWQTQTNRSVFVFLPLCTALWHRNLLVLFFLAEASAQLRHGDELLLHR